MQLKNNVIDSCPAILQDEFSVHLEKYATQLSHRDVLVSKTTRVSNPLWLCDLGEVCDRIDVWKKTFPKIQPLFSLRSFYELPFLKFLKELGFGFVCTSKKDLAKASEAGITEDGIFFNSRSNVKSNVKAAVTKNCTFYVHCDRDMKQLISMVQNPRVIVVVDLEGLALSKSLLDMAKDSDVDVIGIGCCFAQCSNMESFEEILSTAFEAMIYAESIGFQMKMLDIGQLPCGTSNEISDNLDQYLVTEKTNQFLDSLVFAKWPKIITSGDVSETVMPTSFSIVNTVTDIEHHLMPDGSLTEASCVLNDGIYGSFGSILKYGCFHGKTSHPVWSLKSEEHTSNELRKNYRIRGSFFHEDQSDIIATECLLPDVSIGDRIVFDNMGMFTTPLAMDSFEMNGIDAAHVEYFIHENKRDLATKLRCKWFHLDKALVDTASEDGDNSIDDNNSSCLHHSQRLDEEFDVLMENLALLDQNMLSERRGRFYISAGMEQSNEDTIVVEDLERLMTYF